MAKKEPKKLRLMDSIRDSFETRMRPITIKEWDRTLYFPALTYEHFIKADERLKVLELARGDTDTYTSNSALVAVTAHINMAEEGEDPNYKPAFQIGELDDLIKYAEFGIMEKLITHMKLSAIGWFDLEESKKKSRSQK